jgi:EmrB/QacA subfamily drug resistance transporter
MVLAATQFLMVLDAAVMNVSISQLVVDFDTSVTAIQAVITLYSLTMAALMLTGARVGDILGRRRAFTIGLVIYCTGSALTAVSWSVPSLMFGWSILEGVGAALVLPALAALIASNFTANNRVVAYAVIGGVAGAGIAIGPILGGWLTTEYSWRIVFIGEVIIAVAIIFGIKTVDDARIAGRTPQFDWLGSGLSTLGLVAFVLALLMSSTWGWLVPKRSPISPFGFSLTLFVLVGGIGLLAVFVWWQRRRESRGQDPLVHLGLLGFAQLRSGYLCYLAQNLILMGVFFVVPLYLQIVQGLDALETGLKMIPVSVTMFVTSVAGSRLSGRFSARSLARTGFCVILIATVLLLQTIDIQLASRPFLLGMALLGVGMGLIASQLGNVIQSAVGEDERSEAGGFQYTSQQLGSALGVALIGAIVLGGLVQSFSTQIAQDERIAAATTESVRIEIDKGVSFVSSDQVRIAGLDAGIPAEELDALVASYESSQIFALKTGLLAASVVALVALLATSGLPRRPATAT